MRNTSDELPLCFNRYHQCLPSLFSRVDEYGRFSGHRRIERRLRREPWNTRSRCTRCIFDLNEGSFDSRGEFYERLRFDNTYLDKWFSVNANYRKNGYLEPLEINEIIDEILELHKLDGRDIFAFLERNVERNLSEFSLLRERLGYMNAKGPKILTICTAFIFVPTVLKLHESLRGYIPEFDWAYAESIFNHPQLSLTELRINDNSYDLNSENVSYEWIWSPRAEERYYEEDEDDLTDSNEEIPSYPSPAIVRRSRLLIVENRMLDYLFAIENYYHLYKTLPLQFVCGIILVPSTKILRCALLSKINIAVTNDAEKEILKSCLIYQLQADLVDCFDSSRRREETIDDPSRLDSEALSPAWSSIPITTFLRGFFNVTFSFTQLSTIQSNDEESRERFVFSVATIIHRRLCDEPLNRLDDRTLRFIRKFFRHVSTWECVYAPLLLPLSFFVSRKQIIETRKRVLRAIRIETNCSGVLNNAQYRSLDIVDAISAFRGLESTRKKINIPYRALSRQKILASLAIKRNNDRGIVDRTKHLYFHYYLQEELSLANTAACDFFDPTGSKVYSPWNSRKPPIQRYVTPNHRPSSLHASSSSSASLLSFTGHYAYVPVSEERILRSNSTYKRCSEHSGEGPPVKRARITSSLVTYHPIKERSDFVKSIVRDIVRSICRNDEEKLLNTNICKTVCERSINNLARTNATNDAFRTRCYLERWRSRGYEIHLAREEETYVNFVKRLIVRSITL